MHMILLDLLLFGLLFQVSLLVLLQHDVFRLEALFSVIVLLVQPFQSFRQGLCVVSYERLAVDVGGGQLLLRVFAMLLVFLSSSPEKFLFLLLVIEFAVNWVVVVSIPIFASYLLNLFLLLAGKLALVVLFVNVGQDVKLFCVLLKQLLLPLDRKSKLFILEKVFRQLLVVYYVVGVSHRTGLSVCLLFFKGLVRFQVDNIKVFLVFDCLLLNEISYTRWFISDRALFSSVARAA